MRADVRLPLCSASETTRAEVASALSELGFLPVRKPVPVAAA
jgi:hypothetical protein